MAADRSLTPVDEGARFPASVYPGLSAQEVKSLGEAFPPEAQDQIQGRPGLTTIKAAWKFERLNTVLGVGGWTYEVGEPVVTHGQEGAEEVIIRLVFRVGGLVGDGRTEPVWMDRLPPITAYGSARVGEEKVSGRDRLGEAYQGAITSGISRAIQILGVGLQMRKNKGPPGERPQGDRYSGDQGRSRGDRRGGQQQQRRQNQPRQQNPELLNEVLAERTAARLSWDDLGDWMSEHHGYEGRVVDASEAILQALRSALQAGEVQRREG